MANEGSTRREFARPARLSEEPNPGGEYVLVGTKMAYRDDKNVLRFYHTGDKVTLDDEQAQRLRAGKHGSAFLTQEQVDKLAEQEALLEELAVSNEATFPTEDGFQVSPQGTRNRRRAATQWSDPDDAPATREESERDTSSPAPTSSTSTGRRAAK